MAENPDAGAPEPACKGPIVLTDTLPELDLPFTSVRGVPVARRPKPGVGLGGDGDG